MEINIVSYHVYFLNYFLKSKVEKKQAGFRLFIFRQCVPNDLFQNCLLIKWLGSFWFILPYCVLHITNLCIFFHGQILLFSVSIVLG